MGPCFPDQIGIWKCRFLWREENRRAWRKTIGAGTRTNNKLNPYMSPGPGIEPRLHWWKVSALTTAPSLLPSNGRMNRSKLSLELATKQLRSLWSRCRHKMIIFKNYWKVFFVQGLYVGCKWLSAWFTWTSEILERSLLEVRFVFVSQDHSQNSPSCFPYIFYKFSWENLVINQSIFCDIVRLRSHILISFLPKFV